jgi:hypothetical protein
MNIFFLHMNPEKCAQMHADKHVVKLILEINLLTKTIQVLFGFVLLSPTINGYVS